MTPTLRLVLRLVNRTCCRPHSEEIEGDLLELHARRCRSRGLLRAERDVLWEALRSIVGRPSPTLRRRVLPLALVVAAGSTGLMYILLVIGFGEPIGWGWPIVVLGASLELLFWFLLFIENRDRVEQRH